MGPRAVVLALGLLLAPVLALAPAPARADPEDFVEACSNGVAVPDPDDNPDLVQDCAVLLSMRDTLAGDATLNWSADTPVATWRGVEVGVGVSGRVSALRLNAAGLTGTVPEALGDLSGLTSITLSLNSLKGAIPESIGRLSGVRYMDLASNELSGEVPLSMWGLQNLEYLYLSWNRLIGHIPEGVGDLSHLKILGLHHNAFSGPLPQSLTQLRNLESLQVVGNHFSCSPRGLRNIMDAVDYISLPLCSDTAEREQKAAPEDGPAPEDPDPADTGSGLAPTPPAALPVAVNVFAVLALATALLGIAAGLRRPRP